MKIRIRIKIWLVLTALLIPGAFFLAWNTTQALKLEMAEMAAAEDLIDSLSQLRMIAVETTLYHESRASDQWQRKISALQAQVVRLSGSGQLNKARAERFLKKAELAQVIYARLTTLPSNTNANATASEKSANAEQEARTVTALFVVTQEMNDIGREVIVGNQREVNAALGRMALTMLFIILVLAGLVLFMWRLISRGVLEPLQKLERGTQKVAAGDYSVG
jgi:nitrogen fixation/metabolism regulation signal transduction histidine kinase